MKVYAMVQKGTREGKINCDDRALVGNVVLDQGYYETDTDNTNTVLAVSDGVGGSPAGWKAASLTLEGIRCLTNTPIFGNDELVDTLAGVNEDLRAMSMKIESWRGMAATLSMVRIIDSEMKVLQLGDSRVYSLIDYQGISMLRQITTDQNNLLRWLEDPVYEKLGASEEDLKNKEGWNSIISYMGMNTENLKKQVKIIDDMEAEGIIVITSDGIHDFIERDLFRKIILEDKKPKDKMKELMKLARDNGSDDDQSIIIAYL